MKQTFVVEVESPDVLESQGSKLRIDDLKHYLKEGIKEDFHPWCAEKFVISIVEQSSGTPENTIQKALDLLKRASDSLTESDYAYKRNLGHEIEDYLKEIQ